MECGNCRRVFNTSNLKPMLINCGHTLCNECLKDIYFNTLECPFDGVKITVPLRQIRINQEIFELLRQYEAYLSICETHNSAETILCQALQSHSLIEKLKFLVTCKQNHALIFSPDTSEKYRLGYKYTNIRCDYCKLQWKGASYHCSYCLFDLCENCYFDEIHAKSSEVFPGLKCHNSHQLYFYAKSSEYYCRSIDPKGGICCEICQGYWNGSAFSCRICNYDICIACKNKILSLQYFSQTFSYYLFPGMDSNLLQYQLHPYGDQSVNEYQNPSKCATAISTVSRSFKEEETRITPTCNNNHTLILLSELGLVDPLQGYPWKCDVCERTFIGIRYQCTICNYDMCSTCHNYFKSHSFIQPEILQCPNSHRLIRSKDQEELYLCKVGELGYRCNSCNTVFREESNHCRRCDFDLCDKCVVKIIAGNEKGISRKCRAGHEMKWNHDTSRYYSENSGSQMKCDNCTRSFVSVGSFHCRECEEDICVNCSVGFH